MPTLLAMLVSAIAGWMVEGPVRAVLGLGASTLVSFVAGVVSFYFAKRLISSLRDGA